MDLSSIWNLGLLRWLEQIRTPILNVCMMFFTYLGDEIVFLLVALTVLWCIDKQRGYYLLSVGFLGTILSQFLKFCFRVPRPWIKDPNFSIVESARTSAGDYSFPSGHTQTAACVFGSLARSTHSRPMRWIYMIPIVLVPISRMYLGVHTLADVVAGLGLSCILVFAVYPFFCSMEEHPTRMFWMLGIFFVMALGHLLFLKCFPFPAEAYNDCYREGLKNAYSLLGALMGLMVAFPIEQKWIQYRTDAVWWAQVLKVALGAIGALAIKEGLKILSSLLFPGYLFPSAIRYFFVVLFAGAVWPLTFRYFEKLGRK